MSDRVARLLGFVYYEFCFGRRVPGGHTLGSYIHRWEHRRGRRDAPLAATRWEDAYRAGEWDFLRSAAEAERYRAIARYLDRPNAGRILDVGCGVGLLLPQLPTESRAAYVGVDLSMNALRGARAQGARRLICADAERLPLRRSFDAIVFNESLYYFHRPMETFERYLTLLDTRGIAIVSLFLGSRRSRAIRRALYRWNRPVDETPVSHGSHAWSVSVHSPASRLRTADR